MKINIKAFYFILFFFSFYQTSHADEEKRYIVGVDTSHTPYALRDEKGLPTGFDVDIINAIAKEEGFSVVFIPTSWNGIFERLNDGSRDMIASGVTVTPSREALMDFSEPLAQYQFTLLGKSDSPYQTVNDLSGQKIAIVAGTSLTGMLKGYLTDIEYELVEYPSTFLAFRSVLNGETAAVFDHGAALDYYASTMPDNYFSGRLKKIAIPFNRTNKVAIAVRKGNDELREKINSGLNKIKNNGLYSSIKSKWYGIE